MVAVLCTYFTVTYEVVVDEMVVVLPVPSEKLEAGVAE